MDLVAGAVEEAGVDEHHPVLHLADHGGEVEAGAPLLVHDPDLEAVAGKPEQVLCAVEQAAGEGGFLGSVHLGLDDIDRAGRAVGARAAQIVERGKAGNDGVGQPFLNVLTVDPHHRIGHEMPDIAHEHQRPALEGESAAGGLVDAIRLEPPLHAPAALVEAGAQIALHQAEPVSVNRHFLLGVDGRDRILAIHDCGDGALKQEIGHAGFVGSADRMAGVYDDLDMEVVMAKQQRRAPPPGEQKRVAQGAEVGDEAPVLDPVRRDVGVAAAGQRRDLVEEGAAPGDHPSAPFFIVAAAPRPVAEHVGAVEGVVEAAPAGVGGVERVTGVADRDHKLRPGDPGDLGIDILRADREGRGRIDEIADVAKELLFLGPVARPAAERRIALVDPRLQILASAKEAFVLGRELAQQCGEAEPEGGGLDAGAGKRFLFDEGLQPPVHLDP